MKAPQDFSNPEASRLCSSPIKKFKLLNRMWGCPTIVLIVLVSLLPTIFLSLFFDLLPSKNRLKTKMKHFLGIKLTFLSISRSVLKVFCRKSGVSLCGSVIASFFSEGSSSLHSDSEYQGDLKLVISWLRVST